jgi:hypothetical protein
MRGFDIASESPEKFTIAPRRQSIATAAHVAATPLHGQRRTAVFR